MQFGYMPSFYAELLRETEFAVDNFDYIEITLKEELELYSPACISKIKDSIKNLPLMGHIHWNLDFSGGDPAETGKALKSVEIFRELGAEKITVHPSHGKNRNDESAFPVVMKNNIDALNKINDFCRNLNIQLLLENKIHPPFNRAEDFLYMTGEIPGIKITLDTGHAELTSPYEPANFLKLLGPAVGHIHLHDISHGFDHLFFREPSKLNNRLQKFRDFGYDGTVTLEMFEELAADNGTACTPPADSVSSTGILPVIPPPLRLESAERNRLLLSQLNMAKMFINSCR